MAAFFKAEKDMFISCLVTRNEPKKHTGSNAAGGLDVDSKESTVW
jgi:hypothetical protein